MGNNIYLESKPRYEILDGLRGVAAVLVVCFHFFETYFGMAPNQPINHGYLAVDFFFALSGFVIGYAYDDRWDKMSTWGFFKRRLIRLHPMVIFDLRYVLRGRDVLFRQLLDVHAHRQDAVVRGAWGYVVVLHTYSFAQFDGHTRLGRNQSAQWPGVDAPMGVYRQHPLCAGDSPILETGVGHLCGTFRHADADSLS